MNQGLISGSPETSQSTVSAAHQTVRNLAPSDLRYAPTPAPRSQGHAYKRAATLHFASCLHRPVPVQPPLHPFVAPGDNCCNRSFCTAYNLRPLRLSIRNNHAPGAANPHRRIALLLIPQPIPQSRRTPRKIFAPLSSHFTRQ